MASQTIHQTIQASWHDPAIAERYINAENATRPFAKALVHKSGLASSTADVNVFDLATGTGGVVQEIYDAVPKEKWRKVKVLGGDVSESMLGYLAARGEREGWKGLEVGVVDGNDLKYDPASFTHVFCTFAIFAMPDSLPKLHEILKPGGFVGVSTWANLPWLPLVTASIARMPSHPPPPSPSSISAKLFANRPWTSDTYLSDQLSAAGFVDVQTETAKNMARIGSVEAFMATMQMPLQVVKGFWPEEDREKLGRELNEVLSVEVGKMANEGGEVEMEFEGIVGWGYKA